MSIGLVSLPVDDVRLRLIHQSLNPLRESLGDVEALKASINRVGLLQPIIIRSKQDHFEVVAGNRRFEACKKLHWRTIPCHIVELTDQEAFEMALTENLERRTLGPLEEARAFRLYANQKGWGGISELSRKIGRSPAYVSKKIRLLALPDSISDQIFRNRKSSSLAEELLSLEPSEQFQISHQLEKSKMSSMEVRYLVKDIKHSRLKIDERSAILEQLDNPNAVVKNDRERMMIKCVDQVISAVRFTLYRLDGVIEKLDKEWVEKEILMQYRFTLHNQIDSLLHLKKRLVSNSHN